MSRAQRRRFDREFQTLLRTKGDNCSLCNREFQHNDRTYGGFSMRDQVVVVGDCCRSKLMAIYAGGVFSTRNNDELAARAGTQKHSDVRPLKRGEVEKAVAGLQAHFNDLDDVTAQIMRQAGVQLNKERSHISLAATPWKEADAKWFAENPGRSHRLRPMFAGEFAQIESELGDLPEHHEYQTLVRQVEVGKRIRTPFGRDTRMEIPDLEPILHALYDIVSRQSPDARNVPVSEVAELAMKYAGAQDEQSGKAN